MEDGHQGVIATPRMTRSGNGSIDWGWQHNQPEATPPRPEEAPPQPALRHSQYRMW